MGLLIGHKKPANVSPPTTGGYSVSFEPSPSYYHMKEVTGIVGHYSSVLSTDNLFPFVANDVNAYSFFWYQSSYSSNPYFPYNSTNLPDYLLFSSSEFNTVPTTFRELANETSVYGLRVELLNAGYPGNISLYEKGFTGTPNLISLS